MRRVFHFTSCKDEAGALYSTCIGCIRPNNIQTEQIVYIQCSVSRGPLWTDYATAITFCVCRGGGGGRPNQIIARAEREVCDERKFNQDFRDKFPFQTQKADVFFSLSRGNLILIWKVWAGICQSLP